MTDEHTHSLQQIAADRDWWSADAGEHYRELAHWLRGIAAKCRLPYTQKELLDLAGRYETRADRISRGPVVLAPRHGGRRAAPWADVRPPAPDLPGLLAESVPHHLAATALTIYGTVGIGVPTALLTLASGQLYAHFGAHGFWIMAAFCAAAIPLARTLRQPADGPS